MDTVVYKLHNASKYPLILFAVTDMDKKGKGLVKVPYDPENPLPVFKEGWMNLKLGTLFFFNYNIKLKIPSSSTGIMVTHDQQKDLIKFEFSLPKFLFANNVCEVIPPFASKYYNPDITKQNLVNLCAKFWHSMIRLMFKKVIFEMTAGTEANFYWTDVQISRFDVSLNQIFDNKADALFYLDAQRKIRLPNFSESKFSNYATGIAFKSEHYYWKIYHKGADFRHSGRQQIINTFSEYHKDARTGINSRKGVPTNNRNEPMLKLAMDNLDNLENYADRILRYELECGGRLMSYLFNRNLKKKRISEYKPLYRAVFYIMSDQNFAFLRDVQTVYKDVWGRTSKTPMKDYITRTHYIPEKHVLGDKSDSPYRLLKVIDHEYIKRIDRIKKAYRLLQKKYGIKDFLELKKLNKYLSDEQNKHHQFFIEVDTCDAYRGYAHNLHDDDGVLRDYQDLFDKTESKQRFSVSLLVCLIKKFNGLYTQFQFAKLPDYQARTLLIKEANVRHDGGLCTEKKKKYKMRPSHIQAVFDLKEQYSWAELSKSGKYSRKTIHNWKTAISELTELDKNVNFIESDFMATFPTDIKQAYKKHYYEMMSLSSPLSKFVNRQPILMLA